MHISCYIFNMRRGIAGLFLAALVANGTGTAAAKQQPTAAAPESAQAALAREVRDQGSIIFAARTTAGDWDLRAMRPDGSGLRDVTHTPAFSEGMVRLSPDGRRLFYRRIDRGERFDRNRHGVQGVLVLARADGSAPEVFGAAGACPWPSWSPDGTRLACLDRQGISFFDLASRRTTPGPDRHGFFQQMTWSPDGKSLVGVTNALGSGWSVARLDIAGGDLVPISMVDSCTPDWFPDGRQIVFSHRPGKWTQLWRADSDGKNRRLVYAEDGRHVYGGAVSPDGRYVLFTGNKQEDGDVGNAGAPMGLMRIKDAPTGPVLALPAGWEPIWSAAKLGDAP
jgi:Tol biopolymer transport system component